MTTPVDLGLEQVHAAWVQAWAGIVQAIGALLAIGVSLWVAVSADRRAAAAERRAEERAIAAEKAADDRVRRQTIVVHEGLTQTAIELADQAIGVLSGFETTCLSSTQRVGRTYGFGATAPMAEVHAAIEGLADNPSIYDSDLRLFLSRLLALTEVQKRPGPEAPRTMAEWAEFARSWISDIEVCREELVHLLRRYAEPTAT